MTLAEMLPVFFAVLSASLIGSAHCVGMCGPFAIMVLDDKDSNSRRLRSISWYHVGRVITYMLIGCAAGLAGLWLDQSTSLIGWQQSAAWLTGLSMIAFGAFALLRLANVGSMHFKPPATLQNLVRFSFRKANQLPQPIRPLAIGSVTGFLPCGWLYAFVLLAIGTSSPPIGALVMLAFWMGTVPALSVVGLGFSKMSQSWKDAIPLCTAVLMIIAGLSTVSVRAHAEFSSMKPASTDSQCITDTIQEVTQQPMPCCDDSREVDGSSLNNTLKLQSEQEQPVCCQKKK
ncbi:MAG: sulfite exporter TauE/SafE family protein [Fuerstiella sp.]